VAAARDAVAGGDVAGSAVTLDIGIVALPLSSVPVADGGSLEPVVDVGGVADRAYVAASHHESVVYSV
jgi:hypothetical protein